MPDLVNRNMISDYLIKILNSIESHRDIIVCGRKTWHSHLTIISLKKIWSLNMTSASTLRLYAASLRAYPTDILLGFDKKRWIQLADEIRAGDNSPVYRDEQRAFYDSIRDIMAAKIGLRPVVRIF